MSLTREVERRLEELEKLEASKAKALRDAEALADRFENVRPKTYSLPMERYLGLPDFHNEHNA